MMWSSWELSWFATGLVIMIVLGGLATLIVLALRDKDGPLEYLDLDSPSEVHHA